MTSANKRAVAAKTREKFTLSPETRDAVHSLLDELGDEGGGATPKPDYGDELLSLNLVDQELKRVHREIAAKRPKTDRLLDRGQMELRVLALLTEARTKLALAAEELQS